MLFSPHHKLMTLVRAAHSLFTAGGLSCVTPLRSQTHIRRSTYLWTVNCNRWISKHDLFNQNACKDKKEIYSDKSSRISMYNAAFQARIAGKYESSCGNRIYTGNATNNTRT
ncbi:hypothetical protein BDV06DRAFT_131790 [Aspergillus oleicola]